MREWLAQHDEDWLEENFAPFGRATTEIAKRQQDAWLTEAKRFSQNIWHWYQAGLGDPDLLPDFGYWSKLAKYDVTEVCLLSMGIEPLDFLCRNFFVEKSRQKRPTPADHFAHRRYEMFRRKFAPTSENATVFPNKLATWVRSVELDAHPAFLRMISIIEARELGTNVNRPQKTGEEPFGGDRKPEGREIASLAKLLTAIAIEEYGYDPKSRRSPIPGEIEAITDRQGLSVSKDTIRKYLQIGARHLPKTE